MSFPPDLLCEVNNFCYKSLWRLPPGLAQLLHCHKGIYPSYFDVRQAAQKTQSSN